MWSSTAFLSWRADRPGCPLSALIHDRLANGHRLRCAPRGLKTAEDLVELRRSPRVDGMVAVAGERLDRNVTVGVHALDHDRRLVRAWIRRGRIADQGIVLFL